jgi:hypothetical protein
MEPVRCPKEDLLAARVYEGFGSEPVGLDAGEAVVPKQLLEIKQRLWGVRANVPDTTVETVKELI